MTLRMRPDGSFATQAEIDRDNRPAIAIAEFVANCPSRRSHKFEDHQWDHLTRCCNHCGITILDFHNVPYGKGLPCSTD